MKDLSIGIVGGGVVGRATARAYLEHVKEVRVWDKVPERRVNASILFHVIECDLIFVCLPTPQKSDSLECDISAITGFFTSLPEVFCNRNFVLRSTVPIGTTRMLREKHDLPNLVYSPEFLTARTAVADAMMPARNIVGVPNWGSWSSCCHHLSGLYTKRFPGVSVHIITSDESEAVKLFCNGFFAVKIAYFNEVRCLADSLGLDWERVLIGVLSDGRISHSHTMVPGPDGKRGFGGSCLPKDLANLISCLRSAPRATPSGIVLPGLDNKLTTAAYLRNLNDRNEEEKL